MKVDWSPKAIDDLARLHDFLAPANPPAAAAAIQALVRAGERLAAMPRTGERLERYAPREVRRLIVAGYELRYEVKGDDVIVLRVWHAREER
jgi:plasmid stabilization system protein ParE